MSGSNTAQTHPRLHRLAKRAGTLSCIRISLIVAVMAVFLCLLATAFGIVAETGRLALPPEYTPFGLTVRIIGGTLGLIALSHLGLIRHRYQSRRKRRSLPGKLVHIGLGLSIACVVWEIALLALIVITLLMAAAALFGADRL